VNNYCGGPARLAVWLLLSVVGAAGVAHADECQLTILANDMIQYSVRSLQVNASCKQVELTLRHVGKQEAHVLGHDWVLARTADVASLTAHGIAAGFDHGYLPVGDKRVIAATKIVGGGESTTITFSMSMLEPGGDYSFFCSYPGHTPMMRGRFQVVGVTNVASNGAVSAHSAPTAHSPPHIDLP
jgi:azurin